MKLILKVAIAVVIIIGLICLFIYYSELAIHFSKDNPNGEFFKVILTAAGGVAVFYGLYLNSLRIKQQTEQNRIAERRSIDQNFFEESQRRNEVDKRYGEAIAYLGSDNTTIALGGIHLLYQLAKEDNRYKKIVCNLFCSFIRERSNELYRKSVILSPKLSEEEISNYIQNNKVQNPPILIITIIDFLFNNDDECFVGENFDLSYSTLNNISFCRNISNCTFKHSKLTYCSFNLSISSFFFYDCYISNCRFADVHNSRYMGFTIKDSSFDIDRLDNTKFTNIDIENTDFDGNIISSSYFTNSSLKSCTINVRKIEKCLFKLNSSGFIFQNVVFFKTNIQHYKAHDIRFSKCTNVPEISPL